MTPAECYSARGIVRVKHDAVLGLVSGAAVRVRLSLHPPDTRYVQGKFENSPQIEPAKAGRPNRWVFRGDSKPLLWGIDG